MRYLKYAFLVAAICVTLLSILFYFFQRGYDKYYQFENDRLREVIRGKQSHDILFVGSSRIFHHINPKIVDSITHLNTYNAGLDGINLTEANLMLQAYLKNHPAPKLVVADVSYLCFYVTKQPIYNPNIYYEFLDDSLVYNTLKPHKKVFLLKHLPFLRFAEADDMLRQNAMLGLMGKTSVDNRYHYKGFLSYPLDTLELPLKRKYQLSYQIEPKGVELLNQMIATCKQKNIKFAIVYPPEYDAEHQLANPDFFPTINNITKEQQVPFLNYQQKISKDNRLFYDEHHLNGKGAELFSNLLSQDLNKLLNQAI